MKIMKLRQRKIVKNLYTKDLDKLQETTKKINYHDLTCAVESTGVQTDFSEKKKDPIRFLNYIKKK